MICKVQDRNTIKNTGVCLLTATIMCMKLIRRVCNVQRKRCLLVVVMLCTNATLSHGNPTPSWNKASSRETPHMHQPTSDVTRLQEADQENSCDIHIRQSIQDGRTGALVPYATQCSEGLIRWTLQSTSMPAVSPDESSSILVTFALPAYLRRTSSSSEQQLQTRVCIRVAAVRATGEVYQIHDNTDTFTAAIRYTAEDRRETSDRRNVRGTNDRPDVKGPDDRPDVKGPDDRPDVQGTNDRPDVLVGSTKLHSFSSIANGDITEVCTTSRSLPGHSDVTLLVHAQPVTSAPPLEGQVMMLYDIENMQYSPDPMNVCRPCTQSELLEAVCSADFSLIGDIDAVTSDATLQYSIFHVNPRSVIRDTHADWTSPSIYRLHEVLTDIAPQHHLIRDETLTSSDELAQWDLHYPSICRATAAKGSFIFVGRYRLGKKILQCTENTAIFRQLYLKAAEQGSIVCDITELLTR